MSPTAPMERTDRWFAWLSLAVGVAIFTWLGLTTDHSSSDGLTPFQLSIALLGVISYMSVYAACFNDLSKRDYRDPNAKMRWTAFILLCGVGIIVYLVYVSVVLTIQYSSTSNQRRITN